MLIATSVALVFAATGGTTLAFGVAGAAALTATAVAFALLVRTQARARARRDTLARIATIDARG